MIRPDCDLLLISLNTRSRSFNSFSSKWIEDIVVDMRKLPRRSFQRNKQINERFIKITNENAVIYTYPFFRGSPKAARISTVSSLSNPCSPLPNAAALGRTTDLN